MRSVWSAIEEAPDAAAALNWRRWFGSSFDAAAGAFLRETKRPVDRIPCERGCACNHRVLKRGTLLVGVCDCGEECEDIPLTEGDIKVWEVDLRRMARAIANALGCRAVATPYGAPRTIQVAALGNPPLPVLLTVQPDAENYRNTVAHLAAKLTKGFILLTPTRMTDAGALELLGKVSAGCYDLESNLKWLPSGKLHSAKTAEVLFAAHLPEMKEAILESDKALVWRLFGELLGMGTKLKASPARVFDLMVFKKKTRAETAVECDCVASLITKRVALIESHFDMPMDKLLAHASDLKERLRTVKGDRYAKKKRGAIRDEPEQYKDDDDAAPHEEYRYGEGSEDD